VVEGLLGCVGELVFLAGELFSVLPGNAFAATAERTPVRPTLPAMIQRFVRLSFSSAASRVCLV
jgi:hypothetical protein